MPNAATGKGKSFAPAHHLPFGGQSIPFLLFLPSVEMIKGCGMAENFSFLYFFNVAENFCFQYLCTN
jgi:hypothetical protein